MIDIESTAPIKIKEANKRIEKSRTVKLSKSEMKAEIDKEDILVLDKETISEPIPPLLAYKQKTPFICVKNQKSYLLVVKGIGIWLYEENELLYSDQGRKGIDYTEGLNQAVFVKPLNFYLIALGGKLYKKLVNDSKPFLFVNIKVAGLGSGPCLRLLPSDPFRLLIKDPSEGMVLLNLKTRKIESKHKRENPNPKISDYHFFQNRPQKVTKKHDFEAKNQIFKPKNLQTNSILIRLTETGQFITSSLQAQKVLKVIEINQAAMESSSKFKSGFAFTICPQNRMIIVQLIKNFGPHKSSGILLFRIEPNYNLTFRNWLGCNGGSLFFRFSHLGSFSYFTESLVCFYGVDYRFSVKDGGVVKKSNFRVFELDLGTGKFRQRVSFGVGGLQASMLYEGLCDGWYYFSDLEARLNRVRVSSLVFQKE